VAIVRLAGRLEEAHVPGAPAPIDLPANSEASKPLQRVATRHTGSRSTTTVVAATAR
jgi:hypothetical protein